MTEITQASLPLPTDECENKGLKTSRISVEERTLRGRGWGAGTGKGLLEAGGSVCWRIWRSHTLGVV